VDHTGACLIAPALDEEAAGATSVIRDIRCYSDSPVTVAAQRLAGERLRELAAKRVGVEQDVLNADWIAFLERDLPGVEVVFARDAIERLRIRKDESEVGRLRQAGRLS